MPAKNDVFFTRGSRKKTSFLVGKETNKETNFGPSYFDRALISYRLVRNELQDSNYGNFLFLRFFPQLSH